MAYTEQKHPTTEEQEALVSNFHPPHIPHAIEWSFGVRFPGKPGSHRAWEDLSQAAHSNRETWTGSATGSIDATTSWNFQKPLRLLLVSTYLIKRGDVPDPVDYNAVTATVILTLQLCEYEYPCLHIKKGGRLERNPQKSEDAQREWEKGNQERNLFWNLSCYYQLPHRRSTWTRSLLLKKGEHGVGPSMHNICSPILLSVGGSRGPQHSPRAQT